MIKSFMTFSLFKYARKIWIYSKKKRSSNDFWCRFLLRLVFYCCRINYTTERNWIKLILGYSFLMETAFSVTTTIIENDTWKLFRFKCGSEMNLFLFNSNVISQCREMKIVQKKVFILKSTNFNEFWNSWFIRRVLHISIKLWVTITKFTFQLENA